MLDVGVVVGGSGAAARSALSAHRQQGYGPGPDRRPALL